MSDAAIGARFRDAVLIDDGRGGNLVYELERTYLHEPPQPHGRLLPSWPPPPSLIADAGFSGWLDDTGLRTRLSAPSKLEAAPQALPEVTDVSLDLAGSCNMGCSYCFEKPLNSRIGKMSDAVLDRSVDFAFEQARHAPKVVFHFGSGEPLIEFAKLRRLVSMALARGEETGQAVGFELTTNATLVTDEIAQFFADNPFNIRVSCDGPPHVHNAFRPMLNGRASYPLVERGLRKLLDTLPDRVTVNSVFCAGTRLLDLWAWAKSMGIRHYHAIKVGAAEDSSEHLQARELADFLADTRAIADEIFADLTEGRRPVDYHPLAKTVRRMMLPQPITRFCGVAGSYVGIAADGAVYPCFRHLGLEDYRLGHVGQGIDDGRRSAYRQAEAAEVDSRPHCSDCWARYICGGGCYADSVVYEQDKLSPQITHCPYWRGEIAEGIRLYHRLRVHDPRLCLAMFGDDVDAVLDNAQARILEQVRTF